VAAKISQRKRCENFSTKALRKFLDEKRRQNFPNENAANLIAATRCTRTSSSNAARRGLPAGALNCPEI